MTSAAMPLRIAALSSCVVVGASSSGAIFSSGALPEDSAVGWALRAVVGSAVIIVVGSAVNTGDVGDDGTSDGAEDGTEEGIEEGEEVGAISIDQR